MEATIELKLAQLGFCMLSDACLRRTNMRSAEEEEHLKYSPLLDELELA